MEALARAALLALARARVVDQHATHRLGGDREEVASVRGAQLLPCRQAHVGLVHERGRAERVPRVLATELRPGERAQLVVDERDQPVERLGVAFTEPGEELGDGTVGHTGLRVAPRWAGESSGAAHARYTADLRRTPFRRGAEARTGRDRGAHAGGAV